MIRTWELLIVARKQVSTFLEITTILGNISEHFETFRAFSEKSKLLVCLQGGLAPPSRQEPPSMAQGPPGAPPQPVVVALPGAELPLAECGVAGAEPHYIAGRGRSHSRRRGNTLRASNNPFGRLAKKSRAGRSAVLTTAEPPALRRRLNLYP